MPSACKTCATARWIDQAAADQAHAKWDDEKSEFTGTIRLWNWLESLRGHRAGRVPLPSDSAVRRSRTHPTNSATASKLSCASSSSNVRRVRRWRDIHTQLHTVVAEHNWHLNTEPAGYEALHKSMLAGLLGNVGCKSESEEHYNGARGIKFHRHPGANLSKKPGRWIVVAELVETTRLFGRGIASIEPQWLEEVGGHLIKQHTSDPHWEKKTAQVTAMERGTLYGLLVYQGRRVNFNKLDPHAARDIFIRNALVEGQVPELAAPPALSQRQPEAHSAGGRAGAQGPAAGPSTLIQTQASTAFPSIPSAK